MEVQCYKFIYFQNVIEIEEYMGDYFCFDTNGHFSHYIDIHGNFKDNKGVQIIKSFQKALDKPEIFENYFSHFIPLIGKDTFVRNIIRFMKIRPNKRMIYYSILEKLRNIDIEYWNIYETLIKSQEYQFKKEDDSPIIQILMRDDVEEFQKIILNEKIDLNVEFKHKNHTYIELCCLFGAVKCFKHLMNLNPRPLVRGDAFFHCYPSSTCAVIGGSEEIYDLLIENGFTPEDPLFDLNLSIVFHRYNLYDKLKKLFQDDDMYSLVNVMVQNEFYHGMNDFDYFCPTLLLEIACSSHSTEFVQYLMTKYKNFLHPSVAFFITVHNNFNDLAKMILNQYKNKINFNARFDVHVCATITNVDLLTESIRVKNNEMFELINSLNKIDISQSHAYVSFLGEQLSNEDIVLCAIKENNLQILEHLVRYNCFDINQFRYVKSNEFMNPLILAIHRNSKDIIKILLNHPNIDINKTFSYNGAFFSPLIKAINIGNI
ncbi:hypothetical protein TRFO_17628 [Tritrichomonas foetus]|uniref:DUF3447 domain-containing protein n=1 Tax=Tritrichomonas foetus TaxID=1144522 RepID=A0A1J4KME2_9EUKA|nr:hypothetical protein TRFO_17628 [Tritrichomonas foetus]|eukprot:OHT12479.1 hypothetical protein TRFO_17628 [Tritrichomonas foetus]